MSLIALLSGLVLAASAVDVADVRREVAAVYADGDYQAMPQGGGSVSIGAEEPKEPLSGSGGAGTGRGGMRTAPPGSSGELSGLIAFLAWSSLASARARKGGRVV